MDGEESLKYCEGNGPNREGRAAIFAAGVMSEVLADRITALLESRPTLSLSLIGCQEFPFRVVLDCLPQGYEDRLELSLYVPDVYVKKTGLKVAVENGLRVLTWNKESYDELCEIAYNLSKGRTEQGLHSNRFRGNISPEQIQSPSIDALRNVARRKREELIEGGGFNTFFVKSSGSGMPYSLARGILTALSDSREQVVASLAYFDYSKYPGYRFLEQHSDPSKRVWELYEAIYDARLVITYPSEMISAVSALVEVRRDLQILCCSDNKYGMSEVPPVSFVSLIPRGRHELRNLVWAIRKELVKYIVAQTESEYKTLKRMLDEAGLKEYSDYYILKVTALADPRIRKRILSHHS